MSAAELEQACIEAGKCIAEGGLIAYPTEAVYGLGCDPLNRPALQRLLALKQRGADKGFIVVAATESQLLSLIHPLQPPAAAHIRASWPGPVTWVVPALDSVPAELTGGRDTLAVRVSDHPVIRAICDSLGQAIVSTSANLSGQAEMRSADDVRAAFAQTLDYILDAPLGGAAGTSRIFDAATLQQLR